MTQPRGALDPTLDRLIGQLQRRHGAGAARWGSDPSPAGAWPTGIPVLDEVLPAGLPCGRITVLGGARGRATGRLTLLQALAARASRRMEVAYLDLAGTLDPGFLADLGADLDACYVVRPPGRAPGPGLAMARTLVAAGVPWLAVALGGEPVRGRGWEHALSALVSAVQGRGAVACVSAPAPPPAALAYASSLTLGCAPLDWQLVHGDVAGLRIRVTVEKSKLGDSGSEVHLLLRYPRPHTPAEVVGLPAVVEEPAAPPARAIPAAAVPPPIALPPAAIG